MTSAPRADRFEHEALFYRGDDDFLATLLRDALGPDAADVEFLDMAQVGANPARIIPAWADVLERRTSKGRRLRGVGEPAFVGRRTAELRSSERGTTVRVTTRF